jgi:peptidyl-dipeptidase Dcp
MINFSMQAQIPDHLKNIPYNDWDTPYETPPFDLIKDEHYLPAFEYALKVDKEEIRRIEQTKAIPDF